MCSCNVCLRAILKRKVVEFRKGPYHCKWSFSLLLLDNFAVAQLVNVNHRSTTHPPWELLLSSGHPLRCHVLLALATAPERLAMTKVSADDPESAVSVQCKALNGPGPISGLLVRTSPMDQ